MWDKVMEHPVTTWIRPYARHTRSKTLLCSSILVCLAFVVLLGTSPKAHITKSSVLQSIRPWAYVPARDRDNYALTAQQCDTAFPDLYNPITKFFGDLGRNVALQDTMGSMHWGEGRMMIYDQKV